MDGVAFTFRATAYHAFRKRSKQRLSNCAVGYARRDKSLLNSDNAKAGPGLAPVGSPVLIP